MKHVYIIAEIGCNHNGNKDIAKRMVWEAKRCGVDAVKFQAFKAKDLISCYAPKAEYQKATTGTQDSQLEMTAKLELSQEDLVELKIYAESLGLGVFATPFDMGSVKFLESIKQNIWKIPSGEVTNLPYLQEIGSFLISDKKVIVSSGMATVEEIKQCIQILEQSGTPSSQIAILHCNTEYPTPDVDVNILAIEDLKESFPSIPIGFSDHSVGYVAAVGAVILGATIVEIGRAHV